MRPELPLAAALALTASACATPPAGAPVSTTEPAGQTATAEGPRCFNASRVGGFAQVRRGLVRVSVGARDYYELELYPGCPDVDWSLGIGIRSRAGDIICDRGDAELLIPESSGAPVRRCLVRSVRKVLDPKDDPNAR
jgi:hypothetical protein